MKSKIFHLLLSTVLVIAGILAGFKTMPEYRISGSINGLLSGKIYLSYEYNKVTFTDSTELINGSFTFRGAVSEPLYGYLKLPGLNGQRIYFFIENNNINISADLSKPNQTKITGSTNQEVMQAFAKVTEEIEQRATNYSKVVDSIYRSNGGKPLKGFDSLSRIERQKLMAYDFEARKAFVSQHASAVFCAYMINTWYVNREYELGKASELFALLTDEVKASYYGKQAQSVLKKQAKSALGASPDFIIKNTRGVPIKLSSYRGKYVLVDFWASWCIPCRKQNPGLVAAYAKYHRKGFEILGVSLDQDRKAWLKAIKDDGLLWTQLSDLKGFESKLTVDYGIKVIPSNFLLDRKGKVIAKNITEEELNNVLKSISSDQ